MTRGLLAACVLAALAGPAAAEKKVQVLQSEGRADAGIRAKIDAGIRALAKASGEQILPGDITFTEAAAAVGCSPDEVACRDEVLGMLSVDELVVTTVTPKPGGFEIAVRRIGKGGASRDATSFVAHDRLDQLETIAPLFSPAPREPTPPAAAEPGTSPIAAQPIDPYGPYAPGAPGAPGAAASPGAAHDDPPRGRSRLPTIGMAGGGAMLLVGLVLWGSAAGVQREIDDAPVTTKAQLLELQQLEARGDRYAGAGNLLVAGGLVLGGISTYYFVKHRRRASGGRPERAQARTRATGTGPIVRLVPEVWRGGGGLTLTIGGTP